MLKWIERSAAGGREQTRSNIPRFTFPVWLGSASRNRDLRTIPSSARHALKDHDLRTRENAIAMPLTSKQIYFFPELFNCSSGRH